MNDSPIAGEETALGRRDDFSEGRDALCSGMASPRSFDQGIRIARHLITLPWLPVDPDLNIGLPTLYDAALPAKREGPAAPHDYMGTANIET
jgi:hypothetical protein